MVDKTPLNEDKRKPVTELLPKGRRIFESLHKPSDAAAESVYKNPTEQDQYELTTKLKEMTNLLKKGLIR